MVELQRVVYYSASPKYEREHVVAEAARYLGFDKVSGAFAQRMKSIFRIAIRRGEIYRDGAYVGKV